MTGAHEERSVPDHRDITSRKRMMVFAGTAHPVLADEIAAQLGIQLCHTKISRFASGEIYVRSTRAFAAPTRSSSRRTRIRSTRSIMEQLVMIDALKRASAKRITAVIPYYGYSRQDHKVLAREPISAKLVADLLTDGRGRPGGLGRPALAARSRGSSTSPFDHLTAHAAAAGYIKEHIGSPDEIVVVSPDAGRIKSAQRLRDGPALGPGVHLQAAVAARGAQDRAGRGRRRGRGPPLHPDRRHDRHRGDHQRGREGARGRGRGGDLRRGHPPRPVGQGRAAHRRVARSRTSSSRTRCPSPRRRCRSSATGWWCSRSRRSSPRPSTPCSRTSRSPRSSRARTSSEEQDLGPDRREAGGQEGPDRGGVAGSDLGEDRLTRRCLPEAGPDQGPSEPGVPVRGIHLDAQGSRRPGQTPAQDDDAAPASWLKGDDVPFGSGQRGRAAGGRRRSPAGPGTTRAADLRPPPGPGRASRASPDSRPASAGIQRSVVRFERVREGGARMASGSRPAAITWWAVNAQIASLGPGGEGMTSTAASCGGNRPDAAASSMPRRGWRGASNRVKPARARTPTRAARWSR